VVLGTKFGEKKPALNVVQCKTMQKSQAGKQAMKNV
jgi:hypothetical protein